MAIDFKSLLAKPLDDVKRPPAHPAGTAKGRIAAFKFDESRFADKETGLKHGVVNWQVIVDSYDDPEVQAQFESAKAEFPALGKRTLPREMPISGGNEFVTKSFIEGLGISTSGRGFGETIPEAVGKEVVFEVTQRLDKNDDQKVYNDLRALRAPSAS
jgi:hypothetical protein